MPNTAQARRPRTALIMTGGGARAAYQVGFLLAVAKLSSNRRRNPFPILCGTSAGAINAAGIACLADNYGKAVSILAEVWRNMHAGDIYRADPLGIGASGARWMSMLDLGWLIRQPAPLTARQLATRRPAAAQPGFQRHSALNRQRRPARDQHYRLRLRIGRASASLSASFGTPLATGAKAYIRSKLGVEHLLASSAIPLSSRPPAFIVNSLAMAQCASWRQSLRPFTWGLNK
ncbi:MAG: patatin-like phospholipase family protein [Betaproteobacteria bacterium]|nr:patatin-like phospholipase family protein [Candidatus Dechloromonas phosphorivorans]